MDHRDYRPDWRLARKGESPRQRYERQRWNRRFAAVFIALVVAIGFALVVIVMRI